jgi:hypothetical protein
MWVAPAIIALVVLGYPLLVAPTKAVLLIGVAALAPCALGLVTRSTSLVVAGGVLALGQYALSLWLAAGPPHLAGAVLYGIGLVLLVESADFARRVRGAALGPGLVVAQMRYWAAFAALAGPAALVAVGLAAVASAIVRLPWSPAFAAGGAAAALVAVTVSLRAR